MKGVGRATRTHELLSKVHKLQSGREPTARRNRTDVRTKCGRYVKWSWPFEVLPANACEHCFPELGVTDLITAEAKRVEEQLALEGQPEPGQEAKFGRPVNRTKLARLEIGKAIPLDVGGDDDEVIKFFVPVHVTNSMGRITIELLDVDSYNEERGL